MVGCRLVAEPLSGVYKAWGSLPAMKELANIKF